MNLHQLLSLYPVCAVFLFAAQPVVSIEIITTYDQRLSQPPAFDPDATGLIRLVETATRFYEDVIEDEGTLELAFTWGDLGGNGTLGVATTLESAQQRPTVSRMRFNTNESVSWYIDSTPEVHDEFVLQQTSLRELSSEQRQASFTGDPPALLEVGMTGERIVAENTTDLYSVVLHELGHALGLSSVVLKGETIPDDLQVPDVFVGESKFGIRLADDIDSVHLAAPTTAMSAFVPRDTRRLPSATDLLAIAAASQWQQIDLPRQDFLTGHRWSEPANWLGNRLPDDDDEVRLRQGGSVVLDIATSVRSLVVSEETALDLQAGLEVGQLTVSGGGLEVKHTLNAQSLTVGADGFLGITLSGDDDGIRVAGEARIDGVLGIDADEGLALGAESVLLEAGSIQGRFTGIQGVRLDAMRSVAVEVLPDRILGTVALTGDANLDGEVNFGDFIILTNNYGGDDASWGRGNFDGDAAVNFGDFLDLTRSFGLGSAMSPSETVSVPEPPGAAFALWLLLVWRLWPVVARGTTGRATNSA